MKETFFAAFLLAFVILNLKALLEDACSEQPDGKLCKM